MDSQQNAKALYTHSSDLYERFFIDFLHYDQAIESFLRDKHLFQKGMKVLDAGTGTGIVIQALYYILPTDVFQNITFTAFDLTQSMLDKFIEWINENNIKNIEVFQADVFTIDSKLTDDSFDVILSSGMLEYVSKEKFPKAVALLSKKLKKNGKLFLFISRKNLLSHFLLNQWWKANIYSKKELVSTLKQVGLSFISFDTFPRPYQYVNWCMSIIEAVH